MNSISKFGVSFEYKLKIRNLAQKKYKRRGYEDNWLYHRYWKKTKLQFGYDMISITVVLAICCYLLLSQLLKEKLHSEE